MTREPGTYALILKATTRARIRVGRLGDLQIEPGFYVYVGSAFGPGGLAARVGRHALKSKRCHWHIDYLRAHCSLVEVWFTKARHPLEHTWAAALATMPGAQMPKPGFGSSDCDCDTHLIRFVRQPEPLTFRHRLGPGHGASVIEVVEVPLR